LFFDCEREEKNERFKETQNSEWKDGFQQNLSQQKTIKKLKELNRTIEQLEQCIN